jgi:RNA polymerase sigma factor (TIGR02999 family)
MSDTSPHLPSFETVFEQTYAELRRLARSQRRRQGGGGTLNTTGLVHEAFLKLSGSEAAQVKDRGHFFALSARAMRQILVDYARRQMRHKRGGGWIDAGIDPDQLAGSNQSETVLAVHDALARLDEIDPRLTRVAECRYFAGLTEAETAEALDVSVSTVQRTWRIVKDHLAKELARPGAAVV